MDGKTLGYIGVDPSINRTGVVGVLGREVEARQIKIPALLNRPARLACFLSRFQAEVHELDLALAYIAVALIEGYAFGAKGNAVTYQAEVGGICRAVLAKRWPVIEVPPGTWRALTINRFGIEVGKGRKADEAKYFAEITRHFGVTFESTHTAEAWLMCKAADVALNESVKLTPGGERLRDALVAVWESTKEGAREVAQPV